MYSLIFLACASFLLALFITPLCRNLFRRLDVMDRPDEQRKAHVTAVPHLGGVPVAISYLAACGLLLLVPLRGGEFVAMHLALVWKVSLAAGVVFATGVADDLFRLKPWQKLAGQFAGASLAWWAGVRVDFVGGQPVGIELGIALTILWLLATTNALNLIDGVDGLAAGIGMFAAAAMLLAALLLQNNIPLALATVPLVGALAGFLRYNFSPASIFLGDSGSLLVGFLLGCFGVIWSQKSTTVLAMTAPLMALAVPLADTGLSILRRFIRRQPIFKADRGHIHHRLLDRGYTPRSVALILYAVCGIAAAFSLVQSSDHSPLAGAAIVVFCAVSWLGIRYLGYAELNLASPLRKTPAGVRYMEQRLICAPTVDDCWQGLRETCVALGFTELRMSVAGTVYFERWNNSPSDVCWTLRLPLSGSDYVAIGHACAAPAPATLGPIVDVLRRVLPAKMAEFQQPRPDAFRAASGR
jgi:UDP-GlcNAc:undecaprenyl-phosphate GlcNAc-1-phosphate transferase